MTICCEQIQWEVSLYLDLLGDIYAVIPLWDVAAIIIVIINMIVHFDSHNPPSNELVHGVSFVERIWIVEWSSWEHCGNSRRYIGFRQLKKKPTKIALNRSVLLSVCVLCLWMDLSRFLATLNRQAVARPLRESVILINWSIDRWDWFNWLVISRQSSTASRCYAIMISVQSILTRRTPKLWWCSIHGWCSY